MFPVDSRPTDPDAYSVTRKWLDKDGNWQTAVEVTANLPKSGLFALNMDGNWERVARSRPVIVNSIAPAVPLGPVNKTLLGMVVTSALISILALAGWGGLFYWAFSR